MTGDDIAKLALLARVDLTEKEQKELLPEMEGILRYVGEIASLRVAETTEEMTLRNVLREDGEPHEGALYTEALLQEAPSREGNYVKVKQILS